MRPQFIHGGFREQRRGECGLCVCGCAQVVDVCVHACVAQKEAEMEIVNSHLEDQSPSPHLARPRFPLAHPKSPHGGTVAALLAP